LHTVMTAVKVSVMTAIEDGELIDDLMPRIRAAIYATSVSRSAVDSAWTECHKPRCPHRHGSPDEAFLIFMKRVEESIFAELACKAVTEPDLGVVA